VLVAAKTGFAAAACQSMKHPTGFRRAVRCRLPFVSLSIRCHSSLASARPVVVNDRAGLGVYGWSALVSRQTLPASAPRLRLIRLDRVREKKISMRDMDVTRCEY
jgi:hypothetical protein